MLTINPFSMLSSVMPSIAMQIFVILMIILVIGGTILDMIHKKNVKYFFENAKKAKESATRTVSTGEKASIILKTVASDILTSSEFCTFQRRTAHLLGMYGTIIFWVTSFIMIFYYSTPSSITPPLLPMLWHIGAIMTCVGGFWFWFAIRVNVSAEGHPWYHVIFADLFVLSLLATQSTALLWSYTQTIGASGLASLFLILFILSNIVLFGGVYWSKFAHMFYKPGAAIQKHLAEADGSRSNLPEPADKPKQFGLGIRREQPKNY
ncbi:MAG: adenylyl-sulfate reductase [Pseudomonadota bacterium]|nr:adenylyl-sulfate reductase [Pseudomonadota bacterium]MED5274690.1 adenylyl-sulfate reductase [Pseudomonadota bacterium]MED5430299.1 adenylyl-sulfate reductase [Pseudomonadota bacterium]